MFRLVSRQRAFVLSRDRNFLIRAAAAIVVASVVCAGLIWLAFGRSGPSALASAARAAAGDQERMVQLVRDAPELIAWDYLNANPSWRFGQLWGPSPARPESMPIKTIEVLQSILDASGLPQDEFDLVKSYAIGLHAPSRLEFVLEHLLAAHELDTTAPFANEILGDLLLAAGKSDDAFERYRAELRLRDSTHAADRLLSLATREKDKAALQQLLADPALRRSAGPNSIINANVFLGDLGGLFGGVLAYTLAGYDPAHAGLALFVAAVWFILIGQLAGFRRGQLLIYGFAVLSGVFSAILTLFVAVVQEDVFQTMTDSEELIPGLISNIAGTGLREEVIKLIFFLPLVPWLLRRGSEMEVLVVAAMVGLGFALEENISYYARGGASDGVAVSRFLTANFLHMALTGLSGFACWRMIRYPRSFWEQFLATFLVMIAAHGLYNALLSIPAFGEASIAWIIILAMLAYRFFGVAAELRMTGSRQISPLGIFVLGTTLIAGVSLNVVCFGQAPHPAYMLFALDIVPLIPVAFVFVNQFRNA